MKVQSTVMDQIITLAVIRKYLLVGKDLKNPNHIKAFDKFFSLRSASSIISVQVRIFVVNVCNIIIFVASLLIFAMTNIDHTNIKSQWFKRNHKYQQAFEVSTSIKIKKSVDNAILTRDFNAKHTHFNYSKTDQRDIALKKGLADADLFIAENSTST